MKKTLTITDILDKRFTENKDGMELLCKLNNNSCKVV